MIQNHPEIIDPHPDAKVEDSVGTTVNQSVMEHQDEMMAGRSGDGIPEARQDLEEQLPHRVETLPEPLSPPSDALVSDGIEIVVKGVGERSEKAGKALGNDTAKGGKTIKQTSDGSLENRVHPYPPPGTTHMICDGEAALTGYNRPHCSTICYTGSLHRWSGVRGTPGKTGDEAAMQTTRQHIFARR